jgi:hypothetical protein
MGICYTHTEDCNILNTANFNFEFLRTWHSLYDNIQRM